MSKSKKSTSKAPPPPVFPDVLYIVPFDSRLKEFEVEDNSDIVSEVQEDGTYVGVYELKGVKRVVKKHELIDVQ